MFNPLDSHAQKLLDNAASLQERCETLLSMMSARVDHWNQRFEHYDAVVQRTKTAIKRMDQFRISTRRASFANISFMTDKEAEAIEHAERATNLLNRSVAIHEAEMRGEIAPSDATDAVIKLNQEAIDESTRSIAMMKQALDQSDRPPKD